MYDHYFSDESNPTHKYLKSKKNINDGTIDDEIINDPNWSSANPKQFIGRQLITSGSTTITSAKFRNGMEFYVAPMYDHIIHLSDGFHAEYGSTFHAYVRNEFNGGCQMPWEDIFTGREVIYDEENLKNRDGSAGLKYEMSLFISPIPSEHTISVLAKIKGFDGKLPVIMRFYAFDGKIIKTATINTGIKSEIDISGFSQGSYIVSAQANLNDKNSETQNLTANEFIIVRK